MSVEIQPCGCPQRTIAINVLRNPEWIKANLPRGWSHKPVSHALPLQEGHVEVLAIVSDKHAYVVGLAVPVDKVHNSHHHQWEGRTMSNIIICDTVNRRRVTICDGRRRLDEHFQFSPINPVTVRIQENHRDLDYVVVLAIEPCRFKVEYQVFELGTHGCNGGRSRRGD